MRWIGAVVVVAALGAGVVGASPAAAFGLSLGPLHFGLPLPGGFRGLRHRHRAARAHASLHDEAKLDDIRSQPDDRRPQQAQDTQGLTSPLLFPVLASPAVFNNIFWPSSSPPWPLGYDAILQTAFAKARPDQDSHPCQQIVRGAAIVGRLKHEIKPDAAQMRQLQQLGGALAMAAGYLAKTCPDDIPSHPVARMQLMEWQIEKLAQALDFVRQPLRDFLQSLDDGQRARLTGTAPADAGHSNRSTNIAATCAAAPDEVDRSIRQISLLVDPTDEQRDAMANLKQAFAAAASELDAYCPTASPANPSARLDAVEARLDATWRATLSLQVALANFEKSLSAEQRDRFGASELSAAR